MSVVPSAGRAEIVIGVDASVDVDDFALEAPYRVVVDLKGAVLGMAPRYDRVARGGVINVRAAQFKPNVVRVVIELDAAHSYEVVRKDGEVHIVVAGGTTDFAAWHSSPDAATQQAASSVPATAATTPAATKPVDTKAVATRAADPKTPVTEPDVADADQSVTPDANISRRGDSSPSGVTSSTSDANNSFHLSPATAASDQPRITVTYQDA
ncbi:MAG: AMIN domain-containing protein, partial [Thermoanaerobaculia bacterium]